MDDGDEILVKARRRWPRRVRIGGLILLVLLAVAFAVAWTMRVQLASDFIDGRLARNGVQARYEVKRIGFGTQVFENLIIGDPRRPDLIARRVEVQVLIGFTGPRIGLINARGVRMRGRYEGGRLSFGQIDRLLPAPSGLPFRLPDQRVDVQDTAIALTTPAGGVALAVSGRGNLANGFRGGISMVSPELRAGSCVLTRPVGNFVVRVKDLAPRLHGPAAIESLRCGDGVAADRLLFSPEILLSPGIDHWRGTTALRVASLGAGGQRMADLTGRIRFDGDAVATVGAVDLATGAASFGAFQAGRLRAAGRYFVSPRRGNGALQAHVAAGGLVLREGTAGAIVASLRGARGTPAGPIGDALAAALLRAGRGGAEAEADLDLAAAAAGGRVRIRNLALASRSGARLVQQGGEGISYIWPLGSVRLDGALALSGGGFPDARFALRQEGAGAPIVGAGRIAPMAAGGARLALSDIAFTAAPDGRTRFRTLARLDGPFGGGRVTGLILPVAGRFGGGGFALGETCTPAAFQALQVQSLRLAPARLTLCPAGRALLWRGPRGFEGGAIVNAPRLAGRLGGSPIVLASDRVRVGLAGFSAARLAVRLGAASGVSRLDIADLDGRFTSGGAAGGFAGLSGELANILLRAENGRGSWRFAGGDLTATGHVVLADRQTPLRFHPLASDDFRLALANNRIHATGTLHHPASGTRVALATIDHDLGSGAGRALLDVQDLRFSEGFQPEALTPTTVGVVALVNGAVSGRGRIEWDARGSRSSGTFSTAGMNLAAPFGPVEGLATTIEFTDLLGLTSAPGQEARVRLIQAGIDVYDGVVRYQLRPDFHVAVESARWPLAGGTLSLDPTILDFSRESTKYLTFRVEGLDAARFITLLEFSNIDATGTYDGVVPMQFDHGGGRIVNGQLFARPGGGTLSYVGELTDRDLGAYGILAFDALKSLRYSRLEITLDGALDGEFLTRINMDGLARNPNVTRRAGGGIPAMVVGRALNQLARIPFHFNIRIQGPFRALVATARSFEDPTLLIQSALPELLRNRQVPAPPPATPTPPPPVQPEESEPVR
ncbi:MAG TPA: YdbH domain-containing protein [Allosphingosinicella sp.]